MSLSYLVEEHTEDLVIEDMRIMAEVDSSDSEIEQQQVDDDDEDRSYEEVPPPPPPSSKNKRDSLNASQPFDVRQARATAQADNSATVDVRERIKNINSTSSGGNNSNNNKSSKPPYQIQTQNLTSGAPPPAVVTPSPSQSKMRSSSPDVGDLPALSLSRSDKHQVDGGSGDKDLSETSNYNGVTGGRATRVRPLSPPSRAGLDDPDTYNLQNTKTDSTDDFYSEEEVDAAPKRGNPKHFASMDEMPMDERRDYAKEQAERRLEALAICTTSDDPASNFCDSTMTAMNEMCGISNTAPASGGGGAAAAVKQRNLSLGEKHSIEYASGVEEQTAIEVEYVEPLYRGKAGTSSGNNDPMYSPKRKNALLRAMSRKAKDDYQSSKSVGSSSKKNAAKEESRDTSPSTTDEGIDVGATHPSNENVYASFSPSEKRKFLQLINGGMTPFDATSQVMKERMEADESKSLDSSYEEPTGSNSRAIAAGAAVAAGAGAAAVASSSKKNKKKNKKEKDPETPKRRGLAFWKRGSKKDKNKGKDASARALGSTPTQRSPEAAPVERMNRGGVVLDSDEDDQEIVDGFARSGISYYDAVRKDISNEEEEEEADARDMPKSKSPSMKFPRIGFSKLAKSGSNEEGPGTEPRTPPQQTSRGAVAVQPHMTIPSPVVTEEEDEQLRSILTPPTRPQQTTDTDGLVRPIPMKADSESQPRDYEIPPSMSGDSMLTEEKKAEEGYTGSDPGAAIEDELTAQMLTVRRTRSEDDDLQQPTLDHTDRAPRIDLDIDTYLNSTETLSQYGQSGGASFDQQSVVSGKSYRTSQTAGTNFTQSTRTLRPGQAKLRLEKEKQVQQKKPTGWQESILAAAAKSGRVWDPERGWINYVDPKTVGTEDEMGVQTTEPIHAPIDRLRNRPEDEDSLLDEPGSPLREEQAGLARSLAPSTPGRRPKNPKVVSPARDDKPRGWKETMMAATANVNKDGRRWDPERGWIGPDGEVIELAADLDQEREYLKQVAIVADSDTQDFGMVSAVAAVSGVRGADVETLDAIADNNHDSGMQFLSDSEGHTDQDVESTARSQEARSVEGKSVGGRYMQIKDTGSVQSHYRNPNAPRPQQQSRSIPQDAIPEEGESNMARNALTGASPATKEMFARMDQAKGGADSTNVQRDTLDQDEAGLFADGQGTKSQRRSGPIDLDDVYDEEMVALQPESDAGMQGTMSDDGENDGNTQLSNDSFVAAQDFSWDEDDTQDHEIPNRRAVPRLKLNSINKEQNPAYSSPYTPKTAATSSEVSFGSQSTSSRSTIPKLRGPKRDSSPIHAGRRSVTRSEPQSEMLVSTLSPQPPDSSLDEEERMVQNMLKNALPHGEHDGIEEFATPTKNDPPADQLSKQRSEPVRQQILTKPSEDESVPGSVKSLHDYWEARSNQPPDAQSAEWKSFLAKKVQAESAAAASKQARGMSADDERDTLFEFNGSEGGFPSGTKTPRGQPKDGAFDDISDLSPIRHDESDSDFVQSEASTNIPVPSTFLQRLQACAAPVVNKTSASCGPNAPMAAHLAFLRSNPTVGGVEKDAPGKAARSAPPNLCGKPDVIVEEDETDEEDSKVAPAPPSKPEKSRSRSNPRSSRQKDDLSSVVSDEFGAKAAYFEALAMKAATGGSKKKKSRSTGSDVSGSTASKHSGASSKHSEKFQQFLDRRSSKSGDASSPPQPARAMPDTKPPRSDVSSRAERYAAEKVDEMIDAMGSNQQPNGVPLDFRGRPMEEETGAFPTVPRPSGKGSPNARAAAEDLAAARVEAMMQNLSPHNLEFDEGEI
ncbi:MAG: hypothetical protein SGILL_000879 [Bacillariaceae sp.]